MGRWRWGDGVGNRIGQRAAVVAFVAVGALARTDPQPSSVAANAHADHADQFCHEPPSQLSLGGHLS